MTAMRALGDPDAFPVARPGRPPGGRAARPPPTPPPAPGRSRPSAGAPGAPTPSSTCGPLPTIRSTTRARTERSTHDHRPSHRPPLDSPIGTLTVTGDGSTLTGLQMPDQTHCAGRPGAPWRARPEAFREACVSSGLLRRGPHPVRPSPPAPGLRLPAAGLGRPAPRSPTARPPRMASWPGAWATPGRPGPWVWPTGRTPSPSSSPATGSSAPTASLTGYGGGLDRKQILLQLERDHFTPRLALSS